MHAALAHHSEAAARLNSQLLKCRTMRVAMTGGGGFIGSHLLSRMVGAGLDVTLIGATTGRSRYTASLVASGAVRFLCCDGRFQQREILRRAVEDADVLVLLGHETPRSPTIGARLVDELDRNVAPVVRLLEAAEGRIRHVVFASSMSVYGGASPLPVRETDPPLPETPHAIAKLASEEAVRLMAKAGGWTACVLRFANVYGPGEHDLGTIPGIIRAALTDQAVALRDGAFDAHDYVHVADAARAAMRAVRDPVGGTYNIGTGVGTSASALAALVFRVLGTPVKAIRDSASGPLEARRLIAATDMAAAALGFTAEHPLIDGIAEEVGWIRSLASAPASEGPTHMSARGSVGREALRATA